MSKNKKRSNSNGHKKQAPQSKQAAKTQSSSKRIWIIGGVIAVVLGRYSSLLARAPGATQPARRLLKMSMWAVSCRRGTRLLKGPI
jgi:hypothetical protein